MSLTVTSTRKPPQVVAPVEAVVEAVDETYDTIVDAGLAAVGETRTALYGYGIRAMDWRGSEVLLSGTFTVYGNRD